MVGGKLWLRDDVDLRFVGVMSMMGADDLV